MPRPLRPRCGHVIDSYHARRLGTAGTPCALPEGHSGSHLSEASYDKLKARTTAWGRANAEKKREMWRKWYYGTPDQQRARHEKKNRERQERVERRRQVLIDAQGGFCPCGEPLNEDVALDHDHACCDKVSMFACGTCDRGVLHRLCNSGIGMLGDDPAVLRALADYLERARQ